jgi:hypothetical protein
MQPRIATRLHAAALALTALAALLAGCKPEAVLRGTVRDMSGETLPGVAVTAGGADASVITNALGRYRVTCPRGKARLDFVKTGYTPAASEVADARGKIELPEIKLWALPPTEGVFLLEQMRFRELDHPRPNRYHAEKGDSVIGTPVMPKVIAAVPFGGTDNAPGPSGTPMLVAHKLPPYDAHLSRLRQLRASSQPPPPPPAAGADPAPPPAYMEKIWVVDADIPLVERPLDEPDRLLVELAPSAMLDPGTYAVHWGAFEGLASLEQRVFLFRVPDPAATEEEKETEPAPSPEDEKREQEREKKREEIRKDVEKETGEGLG